MNQPHVEDILGAEISRDQRNHHKKLRVVAITNENKLVQHIPAQAPLSPNGVFRLLVRCTLRPEEFAWEPAKHLCPADREEMRWQTKVSYAFPHSVAKRTSAEIEALWDLPALN